MEDLITGNLDRVGLQIDLDAVSDPDSIIRVLAEHPAALGDYNAVIAVSPARQRRRHTSKALVRLVDLVSASIPVLLIDHSPGTGRAAAPLASERASRPVDTLLLPADVEPISAARQIAAALHVLLEQLEVTRGVPPIVVVVSSAAASIIRDDLGTLLVSRLEWIARVTRDTFGLDFAEVNLLQSGAITTIASSRELPQDHPAEDSLTAIAMRTPDLTVIGDTWLDADASGRTPTQGQQAIRFFAACPIRSESGEIIGTLCMTDTAPHRPDDFDFSALFDLALLIEGELIEAHQPIH